MDEGQGAQDKAWNTPRVTINRVYTRQGDQGSTRLVGGQQVLKDDPRIECYGTVDELNSFVGVARQSLDEALARGSVGRRTEDLALLGDTLLRVQHELFNLGSILATLPEDVHPRQPRVTEADIVRLEQEMDQCQGALATLRSFVLPGGCRLNADLHVCRTICRRAERRAVELSQAGAGTVDAVAVRYLNRLSDAFFVWSRWASYLLGTSEVLWDPNSTAAAGAEKKSAG